MADEKNKIDDQNISTNFKRYQGNLDNLYSDDRTVLGAVGSRKPYYNSAVAMDRERLMIELKANLSEPYRASRVSETLVGINGVYADIIQYYTNMPLYRYTVIPVQTKQKDKVVDEAKYKKVYDQMVAIVDGLSMEVIFPKILQFGMIYGIVYLYAARDKNSETVETFMLPFEYCRKGFATNFGTETIVFDFRFFDDMRNRIHTALGLRITDEELLSLFPIELIEGYLKFKEDPLMRYQQLDPNRGAAISFSFNSMPPKIFANFGIIDYESIKSVEIQRSASLLDKIVVHQIPHTPDGNLIFEVEEATAIHGAMASAVSSIKGLKVLTTFGDTKLLELQKEDKMGEHGVWNQAYENLFYNVGMNPSIFTSDRKEAMKASLQKDAAFIFKQLDLIVNFYNLVINNLYNFTPFESRINLLRITNFDEIEKMDAYMKNASFGMGKLEALVATGVKQSEIADKAALEKHLKLDKILVPLQSAYTSTPADVKADEEINSSEESDDTEEVDTNG